MTTTPDLRFPIGRYVPPATVSDADRRRFLDEMAGAPSALRDAVRGLDDRQLDTPYRPGGWTVRQLVHHLPDSHLNGYVRTKLAVTEDEPTIKPYLEARWAELPEARTGPVEMSLAMLDSVQLRWVTAMRALDPSLFARRYFHPEHERQFTVDQTLALYAWHGRHHVAHVTALRDREGW